MDYQILHSVLSELDFDVDTYAADEGVLLFCRVASDYQARADEECLCPDDKEEILNILESMFTSRILDLCSWTDSRSEYSDGDSFSCTIDGAIIKGTVDVHPKRLGIHIESPFTADSFCEMLDLAPFIYTEYPFVGSSTSYEGTHRIHSMIARKYFIYKNSTAQNDERIISQNQE